MCVCVYKGERRRGANVTQLIIYMENEICTPGLCWHKEVEREEAIERERESRVLASFSSTEKSEALCSWTELNIVSRLVRFRRRVPLGNVVTAT